MIVLIQTYKCPHSVNLYFSWAEKQMSLFIIGCSSKSLFGKTVYLVGLKIICTETVNKKNSFREKEIWKLSKYCNKKTPNFIAKKKFA